MSRTIALPDTLSLLLAIERAGEQNPGPRRDDNYEYRGPAGSADVERIAEHLGWRRWYDDGWHVEGEFPPERIRAACKRLLPDELVFEHRPKHGCVHYSVAPEGEQELVYRAEELPELPESPEHHRWRKARETALRSLPSLRTAVRTTAQRAHGCADTDDLGQLVRRVPLVGEMYRKGATSRVTVGDDVECAVEQLIEALEDIHAEEPS